MVDCKPGEATCKSQDNANVFCGKVTEKPIRARILWPALGFPEVIAPSDKIKLLLVADKAKLDKEDVKKYLRYVTWGKRTCRYCKDGSFSDADVEPKEPKIRGEDEIAVALDFANLSKDVKNLYEENGLKYLYEVEIKTKAPLSENLYNLFWINIGLNGDNSNTISDELNFLKDNFVQKRKWIGKWHVQFIRLAKDVDVEQPPEGEYVSEYDLSLIGKKPLEPSPSWKATKVEILHPLFVWNTKDEVNIAHLADTHICVRYDAFQKTVNDAGGLYGIKKGQYNNYNLQTKLGIEKANEDCDIIIFTGDLIDYGCGYDGAGPLGKDKSYLVDRNWFLFYSLIASGDRYKKPMYTVLGNHDWRLFPYGPVNSVFGIASDLNLTTQQTKEIHGPHAEDIWYTQSIECKSLAEYIAKNPLTTSVDAAIWYLLVINPFLDYTSTFPGGYSFLMLDWAKNEKLIELPDFELVGLPWATKSLTSLQKKLVEHFFSQSQSTKAKIVGLHATIIGPNPNMKDNLMMDSYVTCPDCDGTEKKKDGSPCGCITRYQTRTNNGLWRPTHPGKIPLLAGKNEQSASFDRAYPVYGTLEENRSWLIQEFGKNDVTLVLSGHSHRNGAYRLEDGGRYRTDSLVKLVTDESTDFSKDPLSPKFRGPLYLNTTSLGPAGVELLNSKNCRRIQPGFNEIAVKKDGSIPRNWVFKNLDLPVMSKHWESTVKKKSKAVDARTYFRYDRKEKKWKCDIIGIYDKKEHADSEKDGYFDAPWPERDKWLVWVKKQSKSIGAKVYAGSIIGEYVNKEDAESEAEGVFSKVAWDAFDTEHWEVFVKMHSGAETVKIFQGGIIGVYISKEDAEKEKEKVYKEGKLISESSIWQKGVKWECWIKQESAAVAVKPHENGIVGVYNNQPSAFYEIDTSFFGENNTVPEPWKKPNDQP